MKTLISIAAALSLAACNPLTEGEGEPIDPLPMDQDPTADQGRSGTPGMNGGDAMRTGQQQPGLNGQEMRTENPAFDQSEAPEDVRLTAEIRRAVLDAENLSMGADNVQIMTNGGAVRLVGTVATAAEKQEIERIARAAAGAGTITNEIVVEGEAATPDGMAPGTAPSGTAPSGTAPADGTTPGAPDPT